MLEQNFAIGVVSLCLRQSGLYFKSCFFITIFSVRIVEAYKANGSCTCRRKLCGFAVFKIVVLLIGIVCNMLIHIGSVFPSGASLVFERRYDDRRNNSNNRYAQYISLIHI